eukprot:CAMPEP_0202837878 /NCGR_PEP_ID=MMETSP1389-20130828/47407_1 /ASSEMBLY_ACC=CAM_ASM_000865 /TAXON_ID=302021 /ORGANISM="Rhodomonas sp., Strain CCMP768" /LENGTH=106 /DNA_ID=CAMNT_0049514031 /DNA_START=77 /DNA_END=394 /DNA_ORIENTATION=+
MDGDSMVDGDDSIEVTLLSVIAQMTRVAMRRAPRMTEASRPPILLSLGGLELLPVSYATFSTLGGAAVEAWGSTGAPAGTMGMVVGYEKTAVGCCVGAGAILPGYS